MLKINSLVNACVVCWSWWLCTCTSLSPRHCLVLQNCDYSLRFTASEWSHIVGELTRECGLWGPTQPCFLDKWMLDSVEGPSRMRKRMCRNAHFYQHYPFVSRSAIDEVCVLCVCCVVLCVCVCAYVRACVRACVCTLCAHACVCFMITSVHVHMYSILI